MKSAPLKFTHQINFAQALSKMKNTIVLLFKLSVGEVRVLTEKIRTIFIQTTEPVFGHIKAVIGFTGFHLRGLHKVNGEFMLVAIAHNLKKISKWGYKKGFGLIPMVVQV